MKKNMARDGYHIFTYNDIITRFDTSMGKTLGELDETGVFGGNAKNKGVAGDVIEQTILGYPPDSRQEPDIVIEDTEFEVKTIGLIKDKEGGQLVAKEPMSITAVSVDKIWTEDFETSMLWHKLSHMLIVFYLYNHGRAAKVRNTDDYQQFKLMGYVLHEWSERDKEVIESDWTRVKEFVAKVHELGLTPNEEYPKISHELNRNLLYMDTSPKWPNPPRWRLKRAIVSSIVREHYEGDFEHFSQPVSGMSTLEKLCRSVTKRYAGKTAGAIAEELHYEGSLDSKKTAEALVVRMLGGESKQLSKVDVFMRAGIHCKTVVLTSTGHKTEDMKLFRIDFDELCNPEITWENSYFYEWLTSRILCAVFSQPGAKRGFSENTFVGFSLLELDDAMLDIAHDVWKKMRQLVRCNTLRDVPSYDKYGHPIINATGIPRSAPNWPKASESIVFVRGTSTNSLRKPECINGVRMYQQALWIKGVLVAEKLNTKPSA